MGSYHDKIGGVIVDKSRLQDVSGLVLVLAGSVALFFCLALVIRCYSPCPFWDEWTVVNQIGHGSGPGSWNWLWSQSNEHRIVIPRLLIWLDLFAFGGRNVSLFIEIFLLQFIHLVAVCWVVEKYADWAIFLKRSVQGLFAFASFHPNQLENFSWAFQVGFILPFLIATSAIIAVAFFGRWRRPILAVFFAGVASILAAMNLAGGLLIGPVVVALAILKHVPRRYIVWLGCSFFISVGAYLYDYHRSATDLVPGVALLHAKGLFVYVLTYFGASWTKILPHKERIIAFFSMVTYAVILIKELRRPSEVTDVEWFLLAECAFTLATGLLTAFGRLQFGAGQAFASRYQTPAMMYWASLASLVLIRVNDRWPNKFVFAQAGLLLIMLSSIATFPKIWRITTGQGDVLRTACQRVMGPHFDLSDARKLYENPSVVATARPFLRRIWGQRP